MKHSKLFCFSLAAMMAVSMIGLAACGKEKTPKPEDPEELSAVRMPFDDGDRTTNVSVHDPSVFYDEASSTYYAFGTHFAVASSKDLIVWKQEVEDGEWQKLYGHEENKSETGWWSILSQAHTSAGGSEKSTWAPDVNYYNGKYYMYVSVTGGFGSSKSAISRVEADAVMGPYSNETLIVTSDGSGESNAIDPELFYDKNGKLWMVYGSNFGGIFIKELYNSGANWGLPKEEGLGTKLWAANNNNVEGPFIFYNDETDYYYLMTSYGALKFSYNMRIARSKNPDGPYTDVTGQEMTEVANNGGGGNKVAGSFKFEAQGAENGYAALGHNSVVKDAKGRYFVIYHTRRQGKFTADTEGGSGVALPHTLSVSQLYFNEEGWPVMSPVAYVGEKLGIVTQEQAAGEYQIVVHSQGTTAKPVNSVNYTLTEDGKVLSGSTEAGTWQIKENYYVEITLDGITYKGVIAPGWDMYSPERDQYPVFAITAIAPVEGTIKQGVSLWAISPREDL